MRIMKTILRYTLIFAVCMISFQVMAPPAYPANNFKLRLGAQGQICLNCHKEFRKTIKSRSVHPLAKTGKCSACHNPHTSSHKKLLAARPADLCLSCHEDVLPQDARSTHSIVAAGDCAKCHDSHASDNKFILTKAGEALCFECHQDVGQQASGVRFKHEPFIKGKKCLNCHNPHASGKSDFLLSKDVPGLCLGCHKTNKLSFKRKHLNYPVSKTNCGSCHSPHGSNKRGLLYDAVHAPVAEKKCTACHLSASSANPLQTKKQSIMLCRECHNDMIDQNFSKNRVHWPLADKKACLNCHNPHGSKGKKLLGGTIVETCGKCHSDTVQLQELSKKNPKNEKLCEPVKNGDCITCHAPHAADNILLIPHASISDDLCGQCHEWQRHSTHPIGAKVIDTRNKNLTVECLSCHKACGTGNNPVMMPFETTYDLCIQCHPDRRR
jgi:predicted CXXCH cytochrome family protein